ncbi:hypothetical protein SGLAM104S_08085 [Streptomyces glaucescens]
MAVPAPEGPAADSVRLSRRSGAPGRSGGHGRRPAAVQGEFALPETITPALPAAETFTDLGMPGQLLAELGNRV